MWEGDKEEGAGGEGGSVIIKHREMANPGGLNTFNYIFTKE